MINNIPYLFLSKGDILQFFFYKFDKETLAIRRVFSLVDMIMNTKFSNCTLVFEIGAVRQQNMQSKYQNTFQSNLSLTKQ